MYKVGTACSACPEGTSCSTRYPGLCTGDADGAAPRPIPIEHKPQPNPNPNPNPAPKPTTITTTSSTTTTNGDNDDCDGDCKYECKEDEGCSVRYKNYGWGYSGSISGYCWSKTFGGGCSGTPHCCVKCKEWCKKENGNPKENEGKICSVYVKQIDVQTNLLITIVTPVKPIPKPTPVPNLKPTTTKPSQSKNTCEFDCAHMPISCSVTRRGKTRTCFDAGFGGFCYGTVQGCNSCKRHCKRKG